MEYFFKMSLNVSTVLHEVEVEVESATNAAEDTRRDFSEVKSLYLSYC